MAVFEIVFSNLYNSFKCWVFCLFQFKTAPLTLDLSINSVVVECPLDCFHLLGRTSGWFVVLLSSLSSSLHAGQRCVRLLPYLGYVPRSSADDRTDQQREPPDSNRHQGCGPASHIHPRSETTPRFCRLQEWRPVFVYEYWYCALYTAQTKFPLHRSTGLCSFGQQIERKTSRLPLLD